MRDYTKIEAWRLADDLTVAIYEKTRSFPKDELYGLTSQLRRASYSVLANIVEGSSRDSKREYLHFLYIARGSLSESQYFIHLARRLGYLADADAERMRGQTKQVFACLHGLIQAVEKETGRFARVGAALTSMCVMCLARLISGPVVS
jgi:four helix bundle protein